MKDLFSTNSAAYAAFRPRYPHTLAAALAALAPDHQLAWDCATGNGQMAHLLTAHFARVVATDLSAAQLAQAEPHPQIEYRAEPAEQSSLADTSVDLLVVAQAAHWFHFEPFYAEVRRVMRPGGVVALVGYPLLTVAAPAVDALIRHFYTEIVGPYWDAERRHLDANYRSLPFPFTEMEVSPPATETHWGMPYTWSLEALAGYLGTWSAVRHFQQAKGFDPVAALLPELQAAWPEGAETVGVEFPLVLRVGRV